MEFGKSVTLSAYGNKSVLITGATGFVGKVILEKLLRSVPTIDKIYLLIRGNALYPSAYKRFLNEVATSSIFDGLKAEGPEAFEELCREKLRFVSGELTADQFGLNPLDFADLANKIDVVINSAASVNFREPLDAALKTNTLSLRTIIQLAKVRRIPVVHVSTCYVNGYHTGLIAETLVGPARGSVPKNAKGLCDVESLIATLQEKIAVVQARHINGKDREQALINLGLAEANRLGWNDTYTFTKWLGEHVLSQQLAENALTIVRPSIVESTLTEPVPGWIEGVKVADAIIMAYAREKVTFFPGNKHAIIDIIPADLVANSIILSGAEALTQARQHRIYQCSSSSCNPLPIKQVIRHVQEEGRNNFERYGNLFNRQPKRPFMMVPGIVFNTTVKLAYSSLKLKHKIHQRLGGKPSTAKLSNLEAAMKLAVVFSFYTRPRYRFSNARLCELAERMGELDGQMFPVDASTLDWRDYFCNIHLAGLNRFALKPKAVKLKTVKTNRQRQAA